LDYPNFEPQPDFRHFEIRQFGIARRTTVVFARSFSTLAILVCWWHMIENTFWLPSSKNLRREIRTWFEAVVITSICAQNDSCDPLMEA
jgi:hypothetical protein